jgi:hypothetical protein
MTKVVLRSLLAATAGVFGLLWSGEILPNRETGLVATAQARIGRPLTPMSYAGVARRTTRRAVVGGAAVGAAAAGAAYYAAPVVVAPTCVQAVDAYGRVYTRC